MHWLDAYLIQADTIRPVLNADKTQWLQFIIYLAPILTFLTSMANLRLAIFVFGFTKKKNDTDRRVKWFQELVYTPNKDNLQTYFSNLSTLKSKMATAELTGDEKVALMNFVKEEHAKFRSGFIDIIKLIAPTVHDSLLTALEQLTDELIKAIDNDELKLNNARTYDREIASQISACHSTIISTIFNYAG